MPTDYPTLSPEIPYSQQDFTPVATPCACPACTGALVAEEGGSVPQTFLNADERGGVASNGKTSFTIDRAAIQMTGFDPKTMQPYGGWGAVGQAYTVTYGFRSTAPAEMPSDTGDFSRFNEAQIRQAELALQSWADVANIRFVRVGTGTAGEAAYTDSATILFSNYSTGQAGASAFAMYPASYFGATSGSSEAGDVWVNITKGENASPLTGNVGGHVLVHEIGHAIGLAHPGDYNADAKTVITYDAHAEYYEDSRQYTVMSYFASTNTGADYGTRYPAAPQLDDIRAAQVEYGANMTTRTGDTVYGFNSTADREWFAAFNSGSRVVFAVWDAGGNDTLDFSGYVQNGTIDLREGYFSSVGGLRGNVAIAKGAVIENAKGGSGADLMFGNGANNALSGGAGADSIYGGAGADTLSAGAGNSFLRGEDGNDVIYGGDQFDDIHGNKGDDLAYGDFGDDWVVGGQGNDTLLGDGGADIVWGNLGNDVAWGGAGNDQVRGGQGDDVVNGADGNDWLSGDLGTDVLIGGPGADIFHIFTGAGVDQAYDFNPSEDRVQLLPGQSWSVAQVGNDTVVYMGGAGAPDQLILQNVQLGALPQGWIFGY